MADRRDDDERDESAEDPDRKAILARRNRFIAVALSGLSTALAGCDKKAGPAPCLEQMIPPDSGTPEPCLDVAPDDEGGDEGDNPDEGQPMPCLSPPAPDDPPPPDDGPDGTDAGKDDKNADGKKPDATPQACLEVAVPPEPPPHACLMVVAPDDDDPVPDKPDR